MRANSSGSKTAEVRYKAWGEDRYTSGTSPTSIRYTGQRVETSLGLYYYGARWYDPALGRFVQADTIVPEGAQGVQAWDRYAYANNNPVRYNDPSGHCLVLCTAIIGAAVGAIAGAVGYTAYTAVTGTKFNTGNMLLAAGGGAVAGALIGTGVGIAAGMSAAAATSAALATNGDPADELNKAVSIGQTAIESVTSSAKIASQLQSKAGILGITPSGDMSSTSNPVVQNALDQLNNISSSTTSKIWSGPWISKDPIPVFEYIESGLGVVREQTTGALVSITNRVGPNLDKLQELVDKGKGAWLK